MASLFLIFVNFSLFSWEHVSLEDVDYYSEFLGDKKTQEKELVKTWGEMGPQENGDSQSTIPMRGTGPVSTVVCNHTGWYDICSLVVSPLHTAFTPKIEVYNVPILGALAAGLGSLFVDRNSSKDALNAVVE